MAVIFELVVNFPWDAKVAVDAATKQMQSAGGVTVQGVYVPFGSPSTTTLTLRRNPCLEFTVHPRGIGYGGPDPVVVDLRSLTDEDISRIGYDLYELLRQIDGYQAAIVGWDPESLVDVDDLDDDWLAGHAPAYDGFVLADDLCRRWNLSDGWQRFADGYHWLPYRGSKNL